MDDEDEVVLNSLLADGMDLPTAIAGSTRNPQRPSPLASIVGAVAAAIVLVLLWYLFR